MDYTQTLNNYLDTLSSKAPTPGGGNVSAFSGVLAANLCIMVCNLTIGRKKYIDVEPLIIKIKSELENLCERFSELADKDNEAFDKVMEAFKLPKETEDEKLLRRNKIDEATFGAAEIPAQVINVCEKTIPHLEEIIINGNQNSLSDVGVAASLISTANEGAFLNVLINCTSLSNQTLGNEYLKRTEIIYEEVKTACNALSEMIKKKLRD